MIFEKLFGNKAKQQEDEILEEMKMNCLAMNEVLAEMIDSLAHTDVYDEEYETRLKAVDTLTRNIDILKARIYELEKPGKRDLDYIGLVRSGTEILKTGMVCYASYAQVRMLYNFETQGVIMGRNLNRIQLPRP